MIVAVSPQAGNTFFSPWNKKKEQDENRGKILKILLLTEPPAFLFWEMNKGAR
jgi:hypothetical protein